MESGIALAVPLSLFSPPGSRLSQKQRMEAQSGANRQTFRRCFPFHPSFPAAPSHPVGIGGTKSEKWAEMPQTRSAKHCPRPRRAGPPCRRQQHLLPDQPPHGEGPRHRPYLPRPRLRGKREGDRGELETIRPAFGQRQAPCGRRFFRSWGKADNTACRQKGNRTVRPPCKRGAFSPFPGRGAPPPHARRAQRKAGGSRVAPLPPFARLCQGRPDRSPGRGRVTKS